VSVSPWLVVDGNALTTLDDLDLGGKQRLVTLSARANKLQEVGHGTYFYHPTRHPTHFEPSFLEQNGVL
jgi:hypothetical protein